MPGCNPFTCACNKILWVWNNGHLKNNNNKEEEKKANVVFYIQSVILTLYYNSYIPCNYSSQKNNRSNTLTLWSLEQVAILRPWKS